MQIEKLATGVRHATDFSDALLQLLSVPKTACCCRPRRRPGGFSSRLAQASAPVSRRRGSRPGPAQLHAAHRLVAEAARQFVRPTAPESSEQLPALPGQRFSPACTAVSDRQTRHHHMGQQTCGRDTFIDDLRRHRRLDQCFAVTAGPFATHLVARQ